MASFNFSILLETPPKIKTNYMTFINYLPIGKNKIDIKQRMTVIYFRSIIKIYKVYFIIFD